MTAEVQKLGAYPSAHFAQGWDTAYLNKSFYEDFSYDR
jgi:hypothetical protein